MRRYKKKNREKINQIIIGSFLAFLMIFSVVGYIYTYNSPEFQGRQVFEYNGVEYEVDFQTNLLIAEVDNRQILFYNYPDSVVPIPQEAVNDLLSANAPGVYFTFDPTIGEYLQVVDAVRSELDSYFQTKNVFVAHGVHKRGNPLYNNFPLIDCENATSSNPVIKFINSSQLSINYENNCLEMSGSNQQLFDLRDSLMYSLNRLI